MSSDGNPLPPKNNVGLSVYLSEKGLQALAAFSVPFNTVFNNIVLRGRGGDY